MTIIQTRKLALTCLSLAALAAEGAAQTAVDTTKPPAAPDAAPPPEKIVLSPFEVKEDTKGYYAANTMSGTRINTKVEDLASSMTILTKDEMQDFAMLDLNDMFLYTASAEGTGTFTDLSIDRNGSVSDNVQLNPTQANRIRGLEPANVSYGNFETMGRVPVDTLDIDALEVSRGPNSSIAGLGNPSGTVNQVPSMANLSRNKAEAQFRTDSYGGYRTSLDLNTVLVKRKLALRLSSAFQHEGFERKPSGVNTERYNAMFKYDPFPTTSITAGVRYYHQYGVRPNFSTPRDNISYWQQSGRPSWDPVAQVIHVNGQTLGPYTASTYAGPDYFTNTATLANSGQLFVGPSGVSYWSAQSTFASLTNGPTAGAQSVRFLTTSGGPGIVSGKPGTQPLFSTTPAVSDKSIYDWSSVNLASVNKDEDRVVTSTFQIDQHVFSTDRQSLDAQIGFLREDSQRFRHDYVGVQNSQGQSGQLEIDPNEKLLDGSPNPFFLHPFIGLGQPVAQVAPAKWDTYRAQLSYKLDFSREKGLLKWLGRHQVTGYDEYKYRINRTLNYRDAILNVDQLAWAHPPASSAQNNQPNVAREFVRYYVGDATGNNVDYAPAAFSPGTYSFVYGSYPASPNPPVAGSGTFHTDEAQLGLAASSTGSAGSSNSKTILKAVGAVAQSSFWEDRLVTTFGLREDKQYQKSGYIYTVPGSSSTTAVAADGISFVPQVVNWAPGDYKHNAGNTWQGGAVARPFRNTPVIKWLNGMGNFGREAGKILQGLSLTYNKSDSFRPTDPKVDVNLKLLPNPSGTGKDYGFWLDLADGKVVLRFNRWQNIEHNKSGGDAGTIAQRILREDIPNSSNQPYILNVQAQAWVAAVNPTWTQDQIDAEVARQTGIPTTRLNQLVDQFNNISSTQDVIGRGTEMEINVNPNRYWTIAASFTDTKVINSNVSSELDQYLASRLKVWTTIVDQRTGQLWWTTNYGGTQTPQQNYAAFIGSPYNVIKQLQGQANPQLRRYAAKLTSNYRLAGLTEKPVWRNFNVGGAIRWEDRAAIGYYGLQHLPDIITDLDVNNPVYDKSNLGGGVRGNYYFDAFIGYRFRLFNNRIGGRLQLNARNIQENGRLQPIAAFPDGTPSAYRIVDPRQFILSATFDL